MRLANLVLCLLFCAIICYLYHPCSVLVLYVILIVCGTIDTVSAVSVFTHLMSAFMYCSVLLTHLMSALMYFTSVAPILYYLMCFMFSMYLQF